MKNKFKLQWTLGKKIAGLVALLLSFMILIAVYTVSKTRAIGKELMEIAEVDIPLTRVISQASLDQLQRDLLIEKVMVLAESSTLESTRQRNTLIRKFQTLAIKLSDEIKSAERIAKEGQKKSPHLAGKYNEFYVQFEKLLRQHEAYNEHALDFFSLVERNRVREARAYLIDLEKEATVIEDEFQRILTTVSEFTEQAAKSAELHEVQAEKGGFLISCTAIGISLIVSILFIQSLSKRISRLSAGVERVADGNLQGETLETTASDEIGQLAHVINGMVTSIREITRQNREGTQNLSSSSAQILASTQQQATSTKEQASAVHETMATMEEIRQSGNQITEKANQVAKTAKETATTTDSGLQAIADCVTTMESIRTQVEEVAKNIVSLSEKNQAVGDIIATVNELSEQSKLLALNAAIEAAAAGEQGLSFSVVANEMKNLSDQAKDSTGQVRLILSDIQKGINSAVMQTEEAVKRVENGKSRTSESEEAIQEMAKTTEESIQAFQQIVAATNQQQIGFEQVSQALKDIRQATEQTATSTGQLEKAMVGLNSLGSQLKQSVERYSI